MRAALVGWWAGLLSLAFAGSAQALDVSGPISTDVTWTAAQSPYTVTGNVTVQNGAVLTVEPGVTVYVNPGVGLTVEAGALRARGTPAAPIVMTSANDNGAGVPAPGNWAALQFLNGTNDAVTILEHVEVRYGQGIVIQAASPTLNFLTIVNNSGPAISIDLASSPVGSGNQAVGNGLNGVAVPAGDIVGTVVWGLKGLPYVVSQGVVSVGQSPSISGVTPSRIQQGETLAMTVSGSRLGGAEKILFDDPRLSGTIQGGGTPTSVPVQVTAAADAVLGNSAIELQVAAGRPRAETALTVIATQAKVTALTPDTIYTTQPQASVTVSGANFVAESTLLIDGNALTTTYVDAVTLTAQVPSQSAGVKNIAVRSPDPGNSGNLLVSDSLPLYVVVPTIQLAPSSKTLVRGTSGTLTLTIPHPAPAGGFAFTLSSNASIASVPASITIPEGTTAADIAVTAVAQGSTSVTVSRSGFNGASATVGVILPPSVILPTTSLVAPGGTSSLAFTLNVPAPAGGLVIALATSNAAVATVPATITIPEGQTSGVIPVTGVAPGTATINATAAGYEIGSTTVTVEAVQFTVALQGTGSYGSALSVPDGATALYVAKISRPAPASGLTFTLTTGDSSIATVTPATVTVPAGSDAVTGTISIKGVARAETTLIAAAGGLNTSILPLTVTDRLELVFNTYSSPVVVGAGLRTNASELSVCRMQNGAFFYAGAALTVNLASSDSSKATVPTSVTIPANNACASFQVTGVAVSGGAPVTIDATASGYLQPKVQLGANVVPAELRINHLAGSRSTLSRLDDFEVRIYVPGANYEQQPAATITVGVAVSGASVAGIAQIYSQQTGAVVTQGTIGTNQTAVWFNVGRPTAPGSYTISASAPGLVSAVSPVQTVADGAGARIRFNLTDAAVAKQFRNIYDLTIQRTLADGSALSDADAVTVTLTSSDPARVSVPASITIAAGEHNASLSLVGLEFTVPSEPPRIDAVAAGYESPEAGVSVSVVAPELRFNGLDGTRSMFSAQRDEVCVSFHVPSAANPDSQWPVNALTVDWSVTNANPPGIVAALYNSAGGAVSYSYYYGPNSSSCLYVGQPTAVGSYTLTASVAGVTSTTSATQIVTSNAARLTFSAQSMTIGSGLDSEGWGPYGLGVNVTRQAYPGAGYDLGQPLTVTLTSSDPQRVGVPSEVTIPANSASAHVVLSGIGPTGGAPVTISASGAGVDAQGAVLPVNVITPTLDLWYLDDVRSTLSARDDFWVGLSLPDNDAVVGNLLNPLTLNLATVDLGANLARTAAVSASSYGATGACGECGVEFFDTPESAVDGMRETVFATQYENHAWWQADLGASVTFDRMNVYLENYFGATQVAVLVASQPFAEADFSAPTLPATYSNGAQEIYRTTNEVGDRVVTLIGPFTGRYVRIVTLDAREMGVVEVEIYQGGGGASGIVSVYDDFAAGNPISQLTIPAGANSAWAYLSKPSAAGAYLLSVSGSGMEATSSAQVANMPHLVFNFDDYSPTNIPIGTSSFWVVAKTSPQYGEVSVGADTTVTLTSSSPSVATVTPSVLIPEGNSWSDPAELNVRAAGTTTITATAPGFNPAVQSVNFNVSSIPTTASGSWQTYTPSMATDGTLSTLWNSGNYAPAWIAVDLGAVRSISEVRVYAGTGAPAGITNYSIQVSDDAASWTTVAAASGGAYWTITPIAASGRYVRLYINSHSGGSWIALYEFQVYYPVN